MRNFVFNLIIIIPLFFFSLYFVSNYYVNHLKERDLYLKGYYFVSSVIDGDTIVVERNGKRKTIRLIGIDTPEIKSKYREKDECFGHETKKFLKDTIEGKYVKIEEDVSVSDKDKYGRFLRYVYFKEVFINKELIKKGYAYFTAYEKHQFLNDFLFLEKEAQMNNLGLWKICY